MEVSAEKGYLREFGNLVFHFALLGLLVAVAVGKLFGYEGNVIVIADGGPGFCSASPAAFDSFRAGNTVDGTSLHPICVRVNNFQAHYLPSGQATSFAGLHVIWRCWQTNAPYEPTRHRALQGPAGPTSTNGYLGQDDWKAGS